MTLCPIASASTNISSAKSGTETLNDKCSAYNMDQKKTIITLESLKSSLSPTT